MPVIQKKVSIAANATNENLLSGSAFEFLRRNAIVSAGATAEAADTHLTVQSGGDIVLEESEIGVKATGPIIPDDMFYNDVGVAGDRLVMRVRNATAGAIVVRVLVQITDL